MESDGCTRARQDWCSHLSCANAVVFNFSGLTFFADMPVKMGCRGWDNLCPCCNNGFDPCGGYFYAADWHNEWAHGDFPNYKQIYENKEAVSQYTDRQSDGKASPAYGMLQTVAAPAAAPGGAPGGPSSPGRFDEAGYAADWHNEWAHGEFPNYKQTYENKEAVSQYTDRQSDGKASPAYGL